MVTTTGTGIFSGIYNRQPELIKNKVLASLDPNLVGYWDMETLTGTMLKDLSGKGNDGTMTGTTSVSGKVGNARSFNGTSDYVDIGSSSTINSVTDFTISSWVKLGVTLGSANTNYHIFSNNIWNSAGYYLRVENATTTTWGKITLTTSQSGTSTWLTTQAQTYPND